MASADPRGWVDKAVGACFSVLLGAAALYIAVGLIESVWTVLVVIGLVVGIATVSIGVWRSRSRGW